MSDRKRVKVQAPSSRSMAHVTPVGIVKKTRRSDHLEGISLQMLEMGFQTYQIAAAFDSIAKPTLHNVSRWLIKHGSTVPEPPKSSQDTSSSLITDAPSTSDLPDISPVSVVKSSHVPVDDDIESGPDEQEITVEIPQLDEVIPSSNPSSRDSSPSPLPVSPLRPVSPVVPDTQSSASTPRVRLSQKRSLSPIELVSPPRSRTSSVGSGALSPVFEHSPVRAVSPVAAVEPVAKRPMTNAFQRHMRMLDDDEDEEEERTRSPAVHTSPSVATVAERILPVMVAVSPQRAVSVPHVVSPVAELVNIAIEEPKRETETGVTNNHEEKPEDAMEGITQMTQQSMALMSNESLPTPPLSPLTPSQPSSASLLPSHPPPFILSHPRVPDIVKTSEDDNQRRSLTPTSQQSQPSVKQSPIPRLVSGESLRPPEDFRLPDEPSFDVTMKEEAEDHSSDDEVLTKTQHNAKRILSQTDSTASEVQNDSSNNISSSSDDEPLSKLTQQLKSSTNAAERHRADSTDSADSEMETNIRRRAKRKERHPGGRGDGNPFTREEIFKWSHARVLAWMNRHENANSYYYRFKDPDKLQRMLKWSAREHRLFLERYEEFKANGWLIGNSWGLFSLTIAHRVGYQCANYYRSLVKSGVLKDPSYGIDMNHKNKEFRQLYPQLHPYEGGAVPESENRLSSFWATEEGHRIEEQVNTIFREAFPGKDPGRLYRELHGMNSRRSATAPLKRRARRTRTRALARRPHYKRNKDAMETEVLHNDDRVDGSDNEALILPTRDDDEDTSSRPARARSLRKRRPQRVVPFERRQERMRRVVLQIAPFSLEWPIPDYLNLEYIPSLAPMTHTASDHRSPSPINIPSSIVDLTSPTQPPPSAVSVISSTTAAPVSAPSHLFPAIVLSSQDMQPARMPGAPTVTVSSINGTTVTTVQGGNVPLHRVDEDEPVVVRRRRKQAAPRHHQVVVLNDDDNDQDATPRNTQSRGRRLSLRRRRSPNSSPDTMTPTRRAPASRVVTASDSDRDDSSAPPPPSNRRAMEIEDDFVVPSPPRRALAMATREVGSRSGRLELSLHRGPDTVAPITRPARQPLITEIASVQPPPPRTWTAHTGKDLSLSQPPVVSLPPMTPVVAGEFDEPVFKLFDFLTVDFFDVPSVLDIMDQIHCGLMYLRTLEAVEHADNRAISSKVTQCQAAFRAMDHFLTDRIPQMSAASVQSFREEFHKRLYMLMGDTTPLLPEVIDDIELVHSFRVNIELRYHMLQWIEILARYPPTENTASGQPLLRLSHVLSRYVSELVELFAVSPWSLQPKVDRPVLLLWRLVADTADRASGTYMGDEPCLPFWEIFNNVCLALDCIPHTVNKSRIEIAEFIWELVFVILPAWYYTPMGVAQPTAIIPPNWRLIDELLLRSPLVTNTPLFVEYMNISVQQFQSIRLALLRRCVSLAAIWDVSVEFCVQLWNAVQAKDASYSSRSDQLPHWIVHFSPTGPTAFNGRSCGDEAELVLRLIEMHVRKAVAMSLAESSAEILTPEATRKITSVSAQRVCVKVLQNWPTNPVVQATTAVIGGTQPSQQVPSQAPVLTVYGLRDNLSMLLQFSTMFDSTQNNWVSRMLKRALDFDKSCSEARMLLLQAYAYFVSLLLTRNEVTDAQTPLSVILSFVSVLIGDLTAAINEPVPFTPLTLTNPLLTRMSNPAALTSSQPIVNKRPDTESTVEKSLALLSRLVKDSLARDLPLPDAVRILETSVLPLLRNDIAYSNAIREQALALLMSFAPVPSSDASNSDPDVVLTAVAPPPTEPTTVDEYADADEYGAFDDAVFAMIDVDNMINSHKRQKEVERMQREQPLCNIIAQMYPKLGQLIATRYLEPRPRVSVDYGVFTKSIRVLGMFAPMLVRHRAKTWDVFFSDYGADSTYFRLGKRIEQRHVPLRFWCGVLEADPSLVNTHLYPLMNVWFACMLDYSLSAQYQLTQLLLQAIKSRSVANTPLTRLENRLFEGVRDSDISMPQTFEGVRVRILDTVIVNVATLWNAMKGSQTAYNCKLSLMQTFYHLHAVMKSCLLELKSSGTARSLYDRHLDFCYRFVGQLFVRCPELLWDRAQPRSPLPVLLEEFFGRAEPGVIAPVLDYIPNLFHLISSLPFTSDALLIKKVLAIFQDHFETISNHPLRAVIDKRAMTSFIAALSPPERNVPDARQPLRRFVFTEVISRYLKSCIRSIGSFTNAGLVCNAIVLLTQIVAQYHDASQLRADCALILPTLLDCLVHAPFANIAIVRGHVYRFVVRLLIKFDSLDEGSALEERSLNPGPLSALMQSFVDGVLGEILRDICHLTIGRNGPEHQSDIPSLTDAENIVTRLRREFPLPVHPAASGLAIMRAGGVEYVVERDSTAINFLVVSAAFDALYAMWVSSVHCRGAVLKRLGLIHSFVTNDKHNPRRRLETEFQAFCARLGTDAAPFTTQQPNHRKFADFQLLIVNAISNLFVEPHGTKHIPTHDVTYRVERDKHHKTRRIRR